jgi:hypothetical protein
VSTTFTKTNKTRKNEITYNGNVTTSKQETASAKPSTVGEELFQVHLHRETPEYLLADRDGLEISLGLPLLDKFANLLYSRQICTRHHM